MRGNRLRLTAIFFLLNLASYLLYALLRPATEWLVSVFRGSADRGRCGEAIIRHVIQFPFDMFWVVAWAVTMAMVMDALEVARESFRFVPGERIALRQKITSAFVARKLTTTPRLPAKPSEPIQPIVCDHPRSGLFPENESSRVENRPARSLSGS